MSEIKKVYLASPFFDKNEIDAVSRAEDILRTKNLELYSPREHEIRDKDKINTPEWSQQIFNRDFNAIIDCDMVVALYAGGYSDSGTAWECGCAYALGKPVIIVHIHDDKSNSMIHEGCHANIVDGLSGLEKYDFDKMPRYDYIGDMI